MNNPMDAGLQGQRVGIGANGAVVSNMNMQQQQMFANPNPQNNYPPMQPPMPTAAPMGQQGPGSMGDQSPMEAFQKKWLNSDNGQGGQQAPSQQQQQPQQQPQQQQQQQQAPTQEQQQALGLDLSNLTAAQFNELAKGMDFTQGIPDEIMTMFQPDENGATPNLMQGIMALVNHTSRGVYAQSLAGSGRLAGHGIKQYGQQFESSLPSQLRKHQADSVVKSMQIPAALKPSVEGMVNHMLATNPNATTEQLTEMLEEFMGMMGGGGSQGQSRNQQSGNLGTLFTE